MRIGGVCGLVATLLLLVAADRGLSQYDPLAVTDKFSAESIELAVKLENQTREVPLRIDLPASKVPAPVVFFSHGLGGSRDGNHFMGNHWAGRGYLVVFLQHPGSDTSVWQNVPLRERMNAMRDAASATPALSNRTARNANFFIIHRPAASHRHVRRWSAHR